MSVNVLLNAVWPGSSVEVTAGDVVLSHVVPDRAARSLAPPIPYVVQMEIPSVSSILVTITHPDYEIWTRPWPLDLVRDEEGVQVDVAQVRRREVEVVDVPPQYAPQPTGKRLLLCG